jgi:exo-beta-1,3-glucanase (GH17 family)
MVGGNGQPTVGWCLSVFSTNRLPGSKQIRQQTDLAISSFGIEGLQAVLHSCYKVAVPVFFLLAWIVQANCQGVAADDVANQSSSSGPGAKAIAERKFRPFLQKQWIGQGISYGPYRAGQSPGGRLPTRAQLAEDLNLIAQHWNLIRLYGSSEVAADVLDIIHAKKLPLRVMLGAWITAARSSETEGPDASNDAILSNRKEVVEAIRLANAYPDEVIAVSVGNETQVFWSDHRTRAEILIRAIRAVRAATNVPVTTADDFNFWNKPESKLIARELDFIVTHIHPMWAGLEFSTAMPWTERIYAEICRNHPEKTIVIGETGWATQVHDQGEQAKLIRGKAGEEEQRLVYREFTEWARKREICSFFFEAFDEPWKGGSHPNEVEKHWGVFRVNREPKAVLQ